MSDPLTAEVNLIDALLREQRSLTAVERFAHKHKRATGPLLQPFYRDLIPLGKPKKGEQYAFEVNLDKCTGCKACVSACHSLNGLDEGETWRDVGTIVGKREKAPYQQTITTACHHCAEPGCLEGCPVGAYEKDDETGIVRHLDDQCIGCQYCTMMCPYEVPKYSERLGIVRKCDMCHDRLAAGEAPACVQACPHEAITIRIVNRGEIEAAAVEGLLPGAPPSEYTLPSTRYVSNKAIPVDAKAADKHALRTEHAHWPLIIMLVLTQMAVGQHLAQAVLSFFPGPLSHVSTIALAVCGFLTLNAGLFAAVFHLGRPMGAWRFFLGLKTSWMSREILAFSMLPVASMASIGAAWFFPNTRMHSWVACGTAGLGLIAVFTSAMIYIKTRRSFWKPALVLQRFYGAVFTLGSVSAVAVMTIVAWLSGTDGYEVRVAALVAALLQMLSVAWEKAKYRGLRDDELEPAHQSALVLRRLLWTKEQAREVLVVACLAIWIWLIALPQGLVAAAAIVLCLSIAAQVIERYQFFRAVVALRMPGGI